MLCFLFKIPPLSVKDVEATLNFKITYLAHVQFECGSHGLFKLSYLGFFLPRNV